MGEKLTENQENLIEEKVVEAKDKEIVEKAVDDYKENKTELPNEKDTIEETGARIILDVLSGGLYEATINHDNDAKKEEQNNLYEETQKKMKENNP